MINVCRNNGSRKGSCKIYNKKKIYKKRQRKKDVQFRQDYIKKNHNPVFVVHNPKSGENGTIMKCVWYSCSFVECQWVIVVLVIDSKSFDLVRTKVPVLSLIETVSHFASHGILQ